MTNSLRNVSLILKISFLVLVFGLVIILLIKGSLTQGIARTQGERVFENAIPKNAPIKIKIKKEKEQSFKALKNEKWVREFELELTNTGDKPIYFIFIDLITDVKSGDVPLVFSLVYGRVELGDIITKAQPEDLPIKAGETYVFKIHPGQVPAWELSLREKSHPDASSIKAKLEMLSFGDGTGFFLNRPYPRLDKSLSGLDTKMLPLNKSGPKNRSLPTDERTAKTSSLRSVPVDFLPANFLSSASLAFSASAEPVPSDNCLFDYCIGIVPHTVAVCYNCPLQNRPGLSSTGDCAELTYGKRECFIGTEKYLCQTILVDDCGFGPGPPASPTPTPSPSTVSVLY